MPVAIRVSKLFFVLADLMNVDPMYQYSLNFFVTIFKRSLDRADGRVDKSDKNGRKQFFIRKFTRLLYKNVCRSLFEKDKLLFSFLMCLKIMDENKELDSSEARFLMTGGTAVEADRPNPTGPGGWLNHKAWVVMLEMSRLLPAFSGFDKDFEKHLQEWEEISKLPNPHKAKLPWPGVWNDLNLFKRLVVLRILRPDKVIPAI